MSKNQGMPAQGAQMRVPGTGDADVYNVSFDSPRIKAIQAHYEREAMIQEFIAVLGLYAALSPYEGRHDIWQEQEKWEALKAQKGGAK